MISFQNVTREFDLDEQTTIQPIKKINLDIQKGELVVIIGRSGSGKTTLLNLAAGLIKPTSGRVLLDNIDLSAMNDKRLSELRCRKLGFVFQFPSLLPALTVLDNIALPAIFTSGNDMRKARERGIKVLSTLGLESKMKVYPKQLSAGEQKRAVIARALINTPQVILADEPTSDLDEQTENEVMELLREVNGSGVTFMMVTHSLSLVQYASRAFKVENGSLSEVSGSKKQLGS
jgi:ABC-type lipoprotein export system ATPase subunit